MLNDIEYEQAFGEYLQRTTEYEATLEWIKGHLDLLNLHQAKRILSIGGGTGFFDVQLTTFFPNMEHYAVVEPNAKHVEIFKKRVTNDARFTFHQQRFEEYLVGQDFDLILMSHCLYYMDRKAAFELLPKHTKSILIFHNTDLGINNIKKHFGGAVTLPFMYSSNDIEQELHEQKIPYHLHRVDSYVNIAPPYENLINFFLERKANAEEHLQVSHFLNTQYPDAKMYHPVDIIKIDL